ncbi:MAG TPA: delta-60 repeat domain-containing protein [Gaiellaceae bacterium]|nr:delta-60 repeat domain-containing protein [Gaiellaceae bacterium]
MLCAVVLAPLVLLAGASEALAAAASLDTLDFGGKTTTPITVVDLATGVALQPDGKIVVVGYTNAGADDDFAVARYRTDGSLDPSFDGKVATGIVAARPDRAYAELTGQLSNISIDLRVLLNLSP